MGQFGDRKKKEIVNGRSRRAVEFSEASHRSNQEAQLNNFSPLSQCCLELTKMILPNNECPGGFAD